MNFIMPSAAGLSYLLFGATACSALYFPYHTSFIALVLFGSWHLSSEYTYWFSEKKILRKPKQYPAMIIIGALGLSAMALPQAFGSSSNPELSAVFQLSLTGFWIPLSLYPALKYLPETKENAAIKILVFTAIFILPVLIWYYPFAAAFLLVHAHNITPWVFAGREISSSHRVRFFIRAFILSVLIPLGVGWAWIYLNVEISPASLGNALETDLYRHVMTPDQTWGTLLLSFFGYQQMLHYWIWIVEIPSLKNRRPWQGLWRWIPEFFRMLGFQPIKEKIYIAIPFVLIFLNVILFIAYPVEWRNLYFILATFHVLIEWPLLFICRDNKFIKI